MTKAELEEFAPVVKKPHPGGGGSIVVGIKNERLNKVLKESLERKLGQKLPEDIDLVQLANGYEGFLSENLNALQQGEVVQGFEGVEYDPLDPKQKKDQDLIQAELVANLRLNPKQHLLGNTVFKLEGNDIDELVDIMEDKEDFHKLKIEVIGRSDRSESGLNTILPRVGPGTKFTVSDEDGDLVGSYFIGLSKSAARERYKSNPKLVVLDKLLTEMNIEIPSTIHLSDYIPNTSSIVKIVPNTDVKSETGQVSYTVLLNNETLKSQGQTMVFPTRGAVAVQLSKIISSNQKKK